MDQRNENDAVTLDRGNAWVWLGSLAGYEITKNNPSELPMISHRCGWGQKIYYGDHYIGNVIEKCIQHRRNGCG